MGYSKNLSNVAQLIDAKAWLRHIGQNEDHALFLMAVVV
jgi:hypothetical protein